MSDKELDNNITITHSPLLSCVGGNWQFDQHQGKNNYFSVQMSRSFCQFYQQESLGWLLHERPSEQYLCVSKYLETKLTNIRHSNICVQIQMWWWFDWNGNLRRVEDRLDANWQSPDFTMGTNVNSAVFGIYYSPSTGPCLLLSTTSQHSLNTKDTILIVSCSTINNVSLIRQEEFYCGEK